MAQAGRCCMTLFCAWILWSHVWGAKPAHQNHPWRTEAPLRHDGSVSAKKVSGLSGTRIYRKEGQIGGWSFSVCQTP
jgi:hypothetical protein